MADDSARSQKQRELRADRISAFPPRRYLESALAIRIERNAVLHQVWSARMVEAGTGPKHTHLQVDLLVGNPVVISVASARREPQFFEDFPRTIEREELGLAKPSGYIANDFRITARIPGWVCSTLDMDYTAFGTARDTFLFLL